MQYFNVFYSIFRWHVKLLQVNDVKMCSSLPQVRERHQCEETVQFRRHGIRERCRHGPDLSSTFLNPLRLKWFGYPVQSHDSVAFFPIGRRFRAPGPMIGSYQPETEQQIRKFGELWHQTMAQVLGWLQSSSIRSPDGLSGWSRVVSQDFFEVEQFPKVPQQPKFGGSMGVAAG